MEIRGAVLETVGAARPYADSRPLSVSSLTLDEPGPGELLVRIEAASLCHSDLSVVNGDRIRPVPMLLGHEAAGIVEQVGPGGGDVSPGQRVVMTFLPRCGECAACQAEGRPCIPGSKANTEGVLLGGGTRLLRDTETVLHHLGVSAFATHAVVDRRSVVPVDDDVPPDVAALMGCAVLTGGGAVLNAGRPQAGQRVTVVGLGGVGMAAVLTALALEDVEVTAVDTLPAKLQQASELGVARTATPEEATGPRREEFAADVVIEAVGNARAFETSVALTSAGGRTVSVGLPHPDARVTISPLALVAEGRSIIGSYLGDAVPGRDVPRFVELWRAGKLPVEKLVSDTVPLEEINAALDHLADGEALRQVFRFS